jgi:hypothetical protein
VCFHHREVTRSLSASASCSALRARSSRRRRYATEEPWRRTDRLLTHPMASHRCARVDPLEVDTCRPLSWNLTRVRFAAPLVVAATCPRVAAAADYGRVHRLGRRPNGPEDPGQCARKRNPSLPDSEQRHNQKNDTHENARRKRLVLTKTGSGLQAPQQMRELIHVVIACVVAMVDRRWCGWLSSSAPSSRSPTGWIQSSTTTASYARKTTTRFCPTTFEFKVLKTIILPRQARDKCRNNLQILPVFLTGRPRSWQPHRAREWR